MILKSPINFRIFTNTHFLEKTALIVIGACLSGCMTYPRFPSESSTSAEQLIKDFGLDSRTKVIGPDTLKGNTLRGEYKMFITDSNTIKRFFGENKIFYQEQGMVAYGFIPLPTDDAASEGIVQPYKYIDGVFVISAGCKKPERLLVTTAPNSGEYICWISPCRRSSLAGWERWSCSIEKGNTLKLNN